MKMYWKYFVFGGCILAVSLGAALFRQAGAGEAAEKIEPVPYVDTSRFMGDWYEIARYPSFFERCCVAVLAQCDLKKNGDIAIFNRFKWKKLDAPLECARGKAWITDKTTNAKLKVQFFWPFYTSHWIIDLDENYEYVVIGHPNRDSLWIMSRRPVMDETTYNRILARLEARGYDLGKIEKTLQPPDPSSEEYSGKLN